MGVRTSPGIYRKVAASVSVRGEGELRSEDGDVAHPTTLYRVGGIEPLPEQVLVHLDYGAVSHKPRAKETLAGLPVASCRGSGQSC